MAQRQQMEKVAERTRPEISQVMGDVKPKIEAIVEQAKGRRARSRTGRL